MLQLWGGLIGMRGNQLFSKTAVVAPRFWLSPAIIAGAMPRAALRSRAAKVPLRRMASDFEFNLDLLCDSRLVFCMFAEENSAM